VTSTEIIISILEVAVMLLSGCVGFALFYPGEEYKSLEDK